jgi:carboxypeptidase C (cathepsin A)
MSSSADNLEALQNWYADFPEFKVNDLYISGESYAGIYVPYLAHQINAWNTAIAETNVDGESINLKGYAVGNGVTNWKYDTNSAFVEMAYWHSLYSTELYDKI